MRIQVLFFARAADLFGTRELWIEIPDGSDVRAAAEEIQRNHDTSSLLVADNLKRSFEAG